MDFLSKIADAAASGGGNMIRDGRYTYLVESCQVKNGHMGTSFIAELRVIEAEAVDCTDMDGKSVAVQPNKVGTTVSMIANLTKHDSAPGNIKAFVLGCLAGLGWTEDKITKEVLNEVIGPKQPLRGFAVQNATYRKSTRDGKKHLTLNKWSPVTQTQEDVVKQREYLGKSPAAVTAAPAPEPTPQPVAPAPAPPPASNPAGGFLAKLGL